MEPEAKKPFKKITVEYFEEYPANYTEGITITAERRIRVVTTTNTIIGSMHDPITSTSVEYL